MAAPPLVAGETLVDFVPDTAGPLTEVETFHRRAGGAPANVAVALSRLGRTPAFWTRIGTDAFGDFLADRLAAEGIPPGHAASNDEDALLERDDAAATTLAFVSRGTDDPRFSFYRDGTADTRLQPGRVTDERLAATPWVHAGGVTLASEPARSATLDLLERAAEAGCTVSFDPNVRPELWANDAELRTVCGWAIESTDVLIATPTELETLGWSGEAPEALARDAAGDGPHTVVSTLGNAGAIAVAGDDAPWTGTARHGGYEVDAVDDTGAGDAFNAGLIDALLDAGGPDGDDEAGTGEDSEHGSDVTGHGSGDRDDGSGDRPGDLEHALAAANAVAALSTTDRGAMSALPDRRAVTALLEGE